MAAAHIYVLGQTRNRYHDARLSIRDRVRASWRKISRRDYGCHEQGHPRPSVSIKLRSSNFEREQLFFGSSEFRKLRNLYPKCGPTARGYRYRQISSYPTRNCIVHPLSICRLAATQHWRASVSDSTTYSLRTVRISYCRKYSWDRSSGWAYRTKSDTKDIRHHVGLRYEKILGSGRVTHRATFLIRGTNLRGLLRPTRSTWQLRTLHRRITVQREEDPVQGIALHRFLSFERKLEREPGLWTEYTVIINKYRILARFLPVAWRGLQTLEVWKKDSNGFR